MNEKNETIKLVDLSIGYEDTIIIPSMNLEIPRGKISMIIGANGCGKSTLLKSIARIIKPKSGEIYMNGANIKKLAPKEIAKQMAVLPQSPQAPDGLRVKELIAYGRFPYQTPLGGLSAHDHEVIEWAMQSTGISELKDRYVENLSGGQRQRAWIAMALAQETEILVLDEPTTYLDMSHQVEILQLLKEINRERNITIVMVLHELNNACKFADHIIGMKKGELKFAGAPLEVITPENLKTLYEIDATLIMSADGSYPICMDFELARDSHTSS